MTFTIFTEALASGIDDGIYLIHAHAILIGSVTVTPATPSSDTALDLDRADPLAHGQLYTALSHSKNVEIRSASK